LDSLRLKEKIREENIMVGGESGVGREKG